MVLDARYPITGNINKFEHDRFYVGELVGDIGTASVVVPGSSLTVSLADHWSGAINVLDFGASPLAANNLAAFQAAVDSIPTGEARQIIVPATPDGGDYTITGVVTNNSRYPTYLFDHGANIVGGYGSHFSQPSRVIIRDVRMENQITIGVPAVGDTYILHRKEDIINQGPTGGYGIRTNYTSASYGGNDAATGLIAQWTRSQGQDLGNFWAEWKVAASPTVGGADTRWDVKVAEWNTVNRYADTGWMKTRGGTNWSVIIQMVPEANFLTTAVGYNITASLVFSPSSGNKADGIPCQSWTTILIEPNSNPGDGYAAYWSGNNSGNAARDPKAALALDETWQYGTKTNAATFSTGIAHAMAVTQRIAWVNGSDVEQAAIYRGNVAATDPTVNDDITLGYGPGSVWLNTATPKVFFCIVATDGAANWKGVVIA